MAKTNETKTVKKNNTNKKDEILSIVREMWLAGKKPPKHPISEITPRGAYNLTPKSSTWTKKK